MDFSFMHSNTHTKQQAASSYPSQHPHPPIPVLSIPQARSLPLNGIDSCAMFHGREIWLQDGTSACLNLQLLPSIQGTVCRSNKKKARAWVTTTTTITTALGDSVLSGVNGHSRYFHLLS